MSRKLFVGNLPFTTGENELQDLFGQAGTIESVRVMRDMATGRARGFAFVEMQSDEEAQSAIDRFNGASLGGRALVVNEARPKASFGGGQNGDRERGGGGGGRGYRRSEPRW
jgi:RNA recognition motif-containing protein